MTNENKINELIELLMKGEKVPKEKWEKLEKEEKKEFYKLQKKINFDKASKEIDKIFEENNIDREKYSEIYDVPLKMAIKALAKLSFSKFFLVTKRERLNVIEGFYRQKGLKDKWDYQIKYKRTEKSLEKELLIKGSEDINDYEHLFTVSNKDILTPEKILEYAKQRVPEGRTAGVGSLEIGNLSSVARYFYPWHTRR